MRKNFVSLLLLVLVLVLTTVPNVYAAGNNKTTQRNKTVSILFVGNSLVYVYDIPGQLETIAKGHNVKVTCKDISMPSAKLEDMAKEANKEMKKKKYTYVVLQDQSGRPLVDLDAFNNDVELLCKEAVKTGAIPVLYNPASTYTTDEKHSVRLYEAYKNATEENDAILVDAASAWLYAFNVIPNVSLYAEDEHHANAAGAYFTACVFASKLLDLEITKIVKGNLYTDKQAVELGKVAWDFVHLQNEDEGGEEAKEETDTVVETAKTSTETKAPTPTKAPVALSMIYENVTLKAKDNS